MIEYVISISHKTDSGWPRVRVGACARAHLCGIYISVWDVPSALRIFGSGVPASTSFVACLDICQHCHTILDLSVL